jgi:hypothetical protein
MAAIDFWKTLIRYCNGNDVERATALVVGSSQLQRSVGACVRRARPEWPLEDLLVAAKKSGQTIPEDLFSLVARLNDFLNGGALPAHHQCREYLLHAAKFD